jgi:hypothetical protein
MSMVWTFHRKPRSTPSAEQGVGFSWPVLEFAKFFSSKIKLRDKEVNKERKLYTLFKGNEQ